VTGSSGQLGSELITELAKIYGLDNIITADIHQPQNHDLEFQFITLDVINKDLLEDTILYVAAFDANGGVFEPLLGPESAIISDELNHASIIDGVRLCKAKRVRYRHNDMADLEERLKEAGNSEIKIVVTDGVFSMDGTIAKLDKICDLDKMTEDMILHLKEMLVKENT